MSASTADHLVFVVCTFHAVYVAVHVAVHNFIHTVSTVHKFCTNRVGLADKFVLFTRASPSLRAIRVF